MKKTIFIFLIIITSFLFIDNVYADGSTNLGSSLEIDSSKFKYYDLRTMTQEEKLEIGNDKVDSVIIFSKDYAENYILENDNVDNYIIYHNISGSNPYTLICFYDSSKIIKNYLSTYFSSIKDNSNHFLSMGFVFDNQYEYSVRISYDSTKGAYVYGTNSGSNYYEFYQLINVYYYNASQKKITTNYNVNILFDTNLDIKIDNSRVFYGGSSTHSYLNGFYNQILFNTGDICETLIENDTLIDNSRDFTFNDKTPTINFENIQKSYNDNNEIISTSIDIILNNIDTSKHLAQYTTQSSIDYNLANGGIETWEDIVTEEDKTFITNINDTLYVRIIDAEKYWESADNGEELVIDIIKSATYTFTNIVEVLPTIQYSTSIPNLCKITHNDTDYISCVELNMNVKNMNVNKYKLYRMEHYTDTDTYTEWTQCYYTELKRYVNDNMTIFYKVTDKNDNLITSASIKIEEIREFLEQGLFIEFSDKYLKNSRLVEITMKIANDNNYTYYYSTNNGIEYNIVQDISDINLNIKKGIFYTDTNGKIIVKVVDSNGQVVNIFEHTINYKQLQMNNDSFFSHINSVFNFFITPITHIFSLITTFYTTLPTILQYLFSGIFILAIFYYISKFIL